VYPGLVFSRIALLDVKIHRLREQGCLKVGWQGGIFMFVGGAIQFPRMIVDLLGSLQRVPAAYPRAVII